MTTCCSVFGLVFMVLTNLAVIIAFATPYWVIFGSSNSSQGLWAYCKADSCTWVFEDSYKKLETEVDVDSAWWIATLGLMCAALALSLLALLLATVALCCDCRGCNASHAIGGLLVLVALALTAGAILFAIYANQEAEVAFLEDPEKGRVLGWSFWMGVGAAGVAFVSAIIYIIDGRMKTA